MAYMLKGLHAATKIHSKQDLGWTLQTCTLCNTPLDEKETALEGNGRAASAFL